MFLPNPLQSVCEFEDVREVLLRVSRDALSEIAIFKVVRALVLARQQTSAQRRVRDNRDAQLTGRLEQRNLGIFDVEREGRVFDLQCGDGVHGVCTAQSRGGALGETKVLDPAGFHKFSHCTDCVLQGSFVSVHALIYIVGIRTSIGSSGSARCK